MSGSNSNNFFLNISLGINHLNIEFSGYFSFLRGILLSLLVTVLTCDVLNVAPLFYLSSWLWKPGKELLIIFC